MTADDVPALVVRSRSGDRDAFSVLVERFQDVVYNMIHQRLGDSHLALDAAQETFVNAFLGLPGFRGEASFKSWLCSIALREAEKQRRYSGQPDQRTDARHRQRRSAQHAVAGLDLRQ